MRVILEEKVANLGNVGDLVTVKPGYARNFLLPYGKAVTATEENIKVFETRRVELEKLAAERLAAAQARAESLATVSVTIETQAAEEGKLYGSIGPRDIAEAAVKAGIALEKSEVDLPEGPIRMTGEYDVHLNLYSDVTGSIKVIVKPEA